MSNLNGPSWDEATRDQRIADAEQTQGAAPPPAAPKPPLPAPATDVLTITRVISADRWRRAEDAFHQNVEVTRNGAIRNLRGGILAAIKELLS